ncbi:hypothetical protein JCM8208_006849 [Rhodotorula glutinis]
MERPADWSWEKKHQNEFDDIRKALTSFPVIRAPDWSLPFIIETDASRIGLGAVLSQRFRYEHPESGEVVERVHPIEFASKGTKPSEKRYSAFLLELVAVKWALEKFKAYIFGRPIELISDCQALAGILSLQNVSPAHARWREYILGHDIIKFVHREGKLNAAADELSRRADLKEGNKVTPESTIPLSWTDYIDERDAAEQAPRGNDVNKSPSREQSAASRAPTKPRPQKVDPSVEPQGQLEKARSDPFLEAAPSANDNGPNSREQRAATDGQQPSSSSRQEKVAPGVARKGRFEKARSGLEPLDAAFSAFFIESNDKEPPDGATPPEAGRLRRSARSYFIGDDGSLRRVCNDEPSGRECIPERERHALILSTHEQLAHGGRDRVIAHLFPRFYWPNLTAGVSSTLSRCLQCQQFGRQVFRTKLQPISVLAPMQVLSMDYFSLPRVGTRGYKSVLVIVDYFSRFTWAYKFKEDTGRTTVSAPTDLFDRFGCPSVLLSDNGSHLNCGDLVWLHASQLTMQLNHKLQQEWTGPYRIVARGSDVRPDLSVDDPHATNVTFWLDDPRSGRQLATRVHANRLKRYLDPQQAEAAHQYLPLPSLEQYFAAWDAAIEPEQGEGGDENDETLDPLAVGANGDHAALVYLAANNARLAPDPTEHVSTPSSPPAALQSRTITVPALNSSVAAHPPPSRADLEHRARTLQAELDHLRGLARAQLLDRPLRTAHLTYATAPAETMPHPPSASTKGRALSLPLTTAGATLLASPLLKGPSYHAPYGIPAALPTGLDKVALARHLGLNTGAAPPSLLSCVAELLAPMGGTVHAEFTAPEVATSTIAASWRAAVTIVLPPGWVNVPADDGSPPSTQLLTETRLAAGAGSTPPAAAAAAVARLAHNGLFGEIANAAVHHPTVEGSLSWWVRLPLLVNMTSLQTEENIGIIDGDRSRSFLRVNAASYLPSGVGGIELVIAGAIDMRAHLRATRESKPYRAYAQTLHAAREHLPGLLALDSGPTLVALYAKLHDAMPTSITNDAVQRAIAADAAAVAVINGCASALRSIRSELAADNSRRVANANLLVAQSTAWSEYAAATRAVAEWEATHNTTVDVFVNSPAEQRPADVPPPPSLPAAVDAPIRLTLLELRHDYPPGLFAGDNIIPPAANAEAYSTL